MFGLKKLKRDRRDFSHHKTFGATPLPTLPATYLLISTILNQGGLPHCTAYAACSAREPQAKLQFDPEWYFMQEGEVNGEVFADGYDLRVAMATGVKRGFKPLQGDLTREPRYFCEDSYFSALDGQYDVFDNVRSAMWLAQEEKRCALLGTMWYKEWLFSPDGVVQEKYQTLSPMGLHAVKGAGWTDRVQSGKIISIEGTPYLAVQNSFGKGYGDGGVFYFPRAVVNREFVEGAYVWRMLPTDVKVKTVGIIDSILRTIGDILRSLSNPAYH